MSSRSLLKRLPTFTVYVLSLFVVFSFYAKTQFLYAYSCSCSVQQCSLGPDCSPDQPYYYVNASGSQGSCTNSDLCDSDPINGGNMISCSSCAFGYYQNPGQFDGGCTADCNPGNNCETTSPNDPNLISPINGTLFTGNPTTVVLNWQELSDNQWGEVCDGDRENEYRLHFGTTNPPPFYLQGGPTKTVPVTSGTYYWQVKTTNGVDNGEGESDVWSFTVTSNTNPTGRISQPADEANFPVTANNVRVVTANVTDPDPTGLYRIEVWKRDYSNPNVPGSWSTFAAFSNCGGNNNCSYDRTATLPEGRWQLALRVIDNADADYANTGICAGDDFTNPQYWTSCHATQDLIEINVTDGQAPTASMSSPIYGAHYVEDLPVTLSGTAADTGGLSDYYFAARHWNFTFPGPWIVFAKNQMTSQNCNVGNTSCTFSYNNWIPNETGTWQVVVNAVDNSGNACSGNWQQDPANWDDCHASLDDLFITVDAPITNTPPTGTLSAPTTSYNFNTLTKLPGLSFNTLNLAASSSDATVPVTLTTAVHKMLQANYPGSSGISLIAASQCSVSPCDLGANLNWENPQPGSWHLFLRATDSYGLMCSGNSGDNAAACGITDDAQVFINDSPSAVFLNEPASGQYSYTIGNPALTFTTQGGDTESKISTISVKRAKTTAPGAVTTIGTHNCGGTSNFCTPPASTFTWTPVAGDVGTWNIWTEATDANPGGAGLCTGRSGSGTSYYATSSNDSNYAKCSPGVDDASQVVVSAPADAPWFTSYKGNVFISSGLEAVQGPAVPDADWTPPYLSYGQESADFDAMLISDSNIVFANGQTNPNQSGKYVENVNTGGSMWPTTIPATYPSTALDLQVATGGNCSQMFRKVTGLPTYLSTYYASVSCVQQAIDTAENLGGGYKFTGASSNTEGILVVYVTGTGQLNFNAIFYPELLNNRRILFVLGSGVSVKYDYTFGNANPVQSSLTPHIQAGIISKSTTANVLMAGIPSGSDTTAIVEGPIATGAKLQLERDRGLSAGNPAEIFMYNYKYLYQLTNQSRSGLPSAGENYTGLMMYDVQYE